MSSSDFANVYASINNLQNQFDEITGNTLSNYNQLSRIVSQQGNIYNSVYYGTGNIVTGNLSVNANTLINGNLVIGSGNIVSSGNILTSNDIIGRRLFSKSSTNDVTYGVLPYSPDSTLYIQSGNNITGSSANIFFGDYLVVSSDSSRKFMYTKSGNVGIGTSDPKAKLHISGNSYISGNLNVDSGNLIIGGNANISGNVLSTGFSTFTSQTPLQIVSGTAVIGVVPGTNIKFTGNITFGRTFRNVPKITVTSSAGTNSASVSHLVTNKSTTQFDIYSYNSFGSATSSDTAVDFIAIG